MSRVAVFRPDDERLDDAVELLTSLGVDPVADPMLAVEPAGNAPRSGADYVILTSKTGVELALDAGWRPDGETVCAVGRPTAQVLEEHGVAVDLIPDEFSSQGLVDALTGHVEGADVEVARSDHGSPVLTDGLADAGANVHETVLYRLVRPEGSGESAALTAEGDLDGALFTSSLTVEHFLEAAEERGVRDAAIAGLNDAVVGVIGEPTGETAGERGIEVDVLPDAAEFDLLARDVVERIDAANAADEEAEI